MAVVLTSYFAINLVLTVFRLLHDPRDIRPPDDALIMLTQSKVPAVRDASAVGGWYLPLPPRKKTGWVIYFTSMAIEVPPEPLNTPLPIGGVSGPTTALAIPIFGNKLHKMLPFLVHTVCPRLRAVEGPKSWPIKRSAAIAELPSRLESVWPGEYFFVADGGEPARDASEALDAGVIQVLDH